MRSRAQKPSLLLRPCLVDWFEVIWDELRFLLRILILADVDDASWRGCAYGTGLRVLGVFASYVFFLDAD
jgi:hypothetical protein